MARIDSILNLVDCQGANELRLGTDREPTMFADGVQKRLSIPKTSNETLRDLLGEVLPPEREKQLGEQGQVQLLYEASALGTFRVALTRRGPPGGELSFDVVFLRGRGKGPLPAPPPAPAPAPPMPATNARAQVELGDRAPAPPPPLPGVHASAEAEPEVSPALRAMLGRAAALRASDVHLMDGELPFVRVDGRLRAFTGEPQVHLERLLGAQLAGEARKRLAAGASADLGFGVEGLGRFRLNVFQASTGLAAAIRLLRAAPPTLAELGAPFPLDDLIDLPHGLVIVCGPTGSGKSSTLAALGHAAVLRRSCMLLTLEDPIEYVQTSTGARGLVRQRQIGRDVKDFATGLRDALREDPDILLIGEMRDPETISLALTAAETGHLVLASLHCRSAVSAVERIVDTYPPERQQQIRVQLADALRAVVAQRLLPRASGEGRALALEVLRVTHAAASAIREAKTAGLTSVIQSGKKDGMVPLERCLAEMVSKRQVSLEEARAVANDAAVLGSYLSG